MEKSMIGKHVIVRADRAGVFFGILEAKEKTTVKLSNVRKLYYWSGANAIEQIALEGVKDKNNCKFTVIISEMIIEQVIQILPCSEEAILNINSVPLWKKK